MAAPMMSSLLLVLLQAAGALSAGLRDQPIAAPALHYLDGSDWRATSGELSVAATVPGDLITDLQRAGVITDPLWERTFLSGANTWGRRSWSYTKLFNVELSPYTRSVLLVLEGVKMGAFVELNGKFPDCESDQ